MINYSLETFVGNFDHEINSHRKTSGTIAITHKTAEGDHTFDILYISSHLAFIF